MYTLISKLSVNYLIRKEATKTKRPIDLSLSVLIIKLIIMEGRESGEEQDYTIRTVEEMEEGKDANIETDLHHNLTSKTNPNFDFNSFLVDIGVKQSDLPYLIQGGLTEIEDLLSIDNETVSEFAISPVSKGNLRNYITWRNANITAYSDLMDLVNVTKIGIIHARDRNRGDQDAAVTVRRTNAEQNDYRDTFLLRQSVLLQDIADNSRKPEKPFVETFKANSECPKFDGKEKNWSDFKRRFTAYLGSHGLEHLLRPKVENESNEFFDPKYNEKNVWLHHTLMNDVGRMALSYTKMKKNNNGEIIKDGQSLWKKITDWYEGDSNKTSMARTARAKLATTILKKNGDIAAYISSMNEQFQLLEDSGEKMF
ncbi:MAG: hypothetical protein ACREBR_03680 [bacterium]